MDFRAIQFDPATLDQLIASTQSFLPDIDVPAAGLLPEFSFGASTLNNVDEDPDHYSAGSSPRDDQSHTSGEQHDGAPLKAGGGALVITPEERAMLAESGVVIPTDALTLTKTEEKALKSVRRRLRNKISAQDSRRKKKEYVDGLEQRVASCTAVNIDMQSKVNALSHENRSLRQQLLQLKELVARLGGPQSAATTGTILMVLALSFSMFVNPLASSVGANASTSPVSDLPTPTPGARTLKALPAAHAAAPALSTASLRDVLSSLLFDSRGRGRGDEHDQQAPPSLQPLKPAVRAGAP